MARTKRSSNLDSRTARLRLEVDKRHVDPIQPGWYLIYERPKSGAAGSWLARWYDLATKKQKQTRLGTADDFSEADGIKTWTHAQAQKKALEWFTKQDRQARTGGGELGSPPPDRFTVQDAVEGYLKDREHQGMKTAADARRRAVMLIFPELGRLEVESLTRLRLERWRDALGCSAPKVRGKKGGTPKDRDAPKSADEKRARRASANRVLTTLKAALTWAKKRGLVQCSDDAWTSCEPFPGVEEARQAYLTPDQQVRLVNSIQEQDFKRLVLGALTTGARYGELTRMTVRDFDPNPGGVASVLIREGKDGKSRRALLTQEGRAFFEGITAGRPANEPIFMKDADPRRLAVKEGNLKSLPWAPADQTRRMTAACAAAGLSTMGFHQLRHSYASALVTAGMPLAMVAKLTGHADTRMLERHYVHLATSDLSRSLEALAPKFGLEKPKVKALSLKKA